MSGTSQQGDACTRICGAYSRLSSLKKNEAFRRVYKNGRSYADVLLVLYVCKNGDASVRTGVSISKKNGNSVVRHRFIRIVREWFRLHAKSLAKGYDVIVVMRKGVHLLQAKELSYCMVDASLTPLIRKAHLLSREI